VWSPLGIGTYTLIVTDNNGCTDTATVDLGQPAQLQVAFDANVRVGCAPLEVTFTNLSDTQFGCVWQLGDGTTQQGCAPFTYNYGNAGSYGVQLTVTDANGCSNSLTMNDYITVHPNPYANIGVDQQVLFPNNPVVNITNLSEGADTYVWDLGDGLSGMTYFEPGNHTYIENTKDTFVITLIARTMFGCVDTAYKLIIFRNDPVYWAPNTFIPDGDNINDTWLMVFSNPENVINFRVNIFDRWGENIHTSTDLYQGWDGTYKGHEVQDGTYTWIVVFEWVDKRVFEVRGHVNVLR
jgi:gliding motility-associated-like protein